MWTVEHEEGSRIQLEPFSGETLYRLFDKGYRWINRGERWEQIKWLMGTAEFKI